MQSTMSLAETLKYIFRKTWTESDKTHNMKVLDVDERNKSHVEMFSKFGQEKGLRQKTKTKTKF